MGTVVSFKSTSLKDLDEIKNALDIAYDKLHAHYNELVLLENKIADLQAIYDIEFGKYLKRIGTENISEEYFDYTVNYEKNN